MDGWWPKDIMCSSAGTAGTLRGTVAEELQSWSERVHLHGPPQVVVQLPDVLCALILKGAWRHIMINARHGPPAPLQVDRPMPEPDDFEDGTPGGIDTLTPESFHLFSDVLRVWAPVILKAGADDTRMAGRLEFTMPFMNSIIEWSDKMTEDLTCSYHVYQKHKGRLGFSFDATFLARCIISADMLHDDRRLKDMFVRGMHAWLPTCL